MPDPTLLGLTAAIVSAHISKSPVHDGALPGLINSVYGALESVSTGATSEPPSAPTPAVPIKKSIFPDYIVCLEDGRKLKMLKRHLKATYGMTPDQYRERWSLPRDYPMVAPNYSVLRSGLAKQTGPGKR